MNKLKLILIIILVVFTISCDIDNNNDSGDSGDDDSLIKGDGVYYSPDGKAKLTIEGNKRILRLSGNDYENGYNHGYLLGAEIMELTVDYISERFGDNVTLYDNTRDTQSVYYLWEQNYENELQGLLDGIEDAFDSHPVYFTLEGHPERELTLDDVKLFTSYPDWNCSSFMVWGDVRSDGSPIMGRNLEYRIDQNKSIKKYQLILAYEPPDGTKWVNVSICGYIGCLTGMNEYGVCASIHDTNGYDTTDITGFFPRTLALRKILEEMDNTNTPSDAETVLDDIITLQGSNYDICFKSKDDLDNTKSDDYIAGIIEYDGKEDHPDGRATLRSPSDNPTLPDDTHDQKINNTYTLINTNHYLKRNTIVPYTNDPRYMTLKNQIKNITTDNDVTVNEAIDTMEMVGFSGTVHTVVFEPDSMELHIWLSKGSLGAFDCDRHDYTFNEMYE